MTTNNHSYIILIADDDEINRVILKHMLKYTNTDISCVADGEEAMTFIHENNNRRIILLLDLNMPNMDGHEVIARVNMDSEIKSRVRIIVITANLLAAYLKNGMGDSVLECLEKPVNKEELIALINLGATQLK